MYNDNVLVPTFFAKPFDVIFITITLMKYSESMKQIGWILTEIF